MPHFSDHWRHCGLCHSPCGVARRRSASYPSRSPCGYGAGNRAAPVEADQTTPSLASADNLIAQAFPRRVVRSGRQGTSLAGNVQIAGSPVAGAKVTLYAAGTGAPAELAEGQTNGDGAFQLGGGPAPRGRVFYVVAKGGASKAAHAKVPNEAIRLMVVLGGTLPRKVTVNEFTTIASVVTCEQFLKGEALSGKSLGLRIAAGNVPNFVRSRNRRLRSRNRRRARHGADAHYGELRDACQPDGWRYHAEYSRTRAADSSPQRLHQPAMSRRTH